MPKYVVSSTPEPASWSNSTVLTGDVVSGVSKLKDDHDGDIVVYASTQLAHTLMEHDLIEELRLIIFPVVVGAGERLFAGTDDARPMRLTRIQAVGDTLALLSYERAGRNPLAAGGPGGSLRGARAPRRPGSPRPISLAGAANCSARPACRVTAAPSTGSWRLRRARWNARSLCGPVIRAT